MVHCTITLQNNERAFYQAGELLKGTIELYVDKPKKFRGLYLLVHGAAQCNWTETRYKSTGHGKNRKSHRETLYFKGEEVYLNQRTYMFGHKGADAVEMTPGTYRYDYACPLPFQLPSSFEAKHGSIRYHVEAVLDIPWSFDRESKVQFTVVHQDDLNLNPGLKNPCKSEETKQFCSIFCQSGSLSMTVCLPHSGFVPGQKLPVTVSYFNNSNNTVDFTRFSLKRVTRYNASTPHGKSKFEADKIVETRRDGVAKGQRNSIVENLDIPSFTLKSNARVCNVLQVYYELKVEAEISGCHRNMDVTFPIEIGSIPLNFDAPQAGYNPITLQPAYNPMSSQATTYAPNFNQAAYNPMGPQNGYSAMMPQAPFNPMAPQAPYNPMAPQAPYNPMAPQAPYNPMAPQAPYNPMASQVPYNPSAPQPELNGSSEKSFHPIVPMGNAPPPSFDEAIKMGSPQRQEEDSSRKPNLSFDTSAPSAPSNE